MRYLVYVVAVLVAAGTVYYLGVDGQQTASAPSAAAEAAVASAATTPGSEAGNTEVGEVRTVNLKVPGMHCPMACYPSVKKALEGESGVQDVDLAAQKEEGLIDNPVVVIQHDSQFDLDHAVASLEKLGFAGAAVTTE